MSRTLPRNAFTRLEETDSTNLYALRRMTELPDRHVIVADRQTRGRGRMGRSWRTGAGDLAASIVLKPASTEHIGNLTQYMAVVLCRTFAPYGVKAGIKWPNDVLVDGRKLAGILGEASFSGTTFKGMVVGIGVNLNMDREEIERIDKPATSLNLLRGAPVDRDSFLEDLLGRFFGDYPRFLETGFPLIRGEFIEKDVLIGREINLQSAGSRIKGKVLDVSMEGFLLLECEGGGRRVVTLGEAEC